MDVVDTNQSSETASTVYLSLTPSTIGAFSCNSETEQEGWIMGVTIDSLSSTWRQAGAESLPLDSGAQLHACSINIEGKGTVAWSWIPHSDWNSDPTWRRTIGDFQTSRGTDNWSAFPCVWGSETHPLSPSRGTGVIFVQTQVQSSFLTRSRPNTAKHSCTRERLCSLSKGMLMAPLVTAGVSDDVSQELQIPISPQTLDHVEEPMPARLATLKGPGTPDQIVLDQHSLTHFPSHPWCKMCVESRGRDSPHRERKATQVCLNFSLLRLHGRWRPSADCVFRRGDRDLFWSYTRDNGARCQKDGHVLRGCRKTHILHWELCDPRLLGHQNFPLWAQLYQYVFCKKPL